MMQAEFRYDIEVPLFCFFYIKSVFMRKNNDELQTGCIIASLSGVYCSRQTANMEAVKG
ncbi:hypothetical protein DFQ00_12661 [Paenibacillus barcinonensis]|uniref:Uncharacterized protein n=1 Tax=Paenibacillus barcinonensis TaxID=198119 RepID=A0A2V4VNF7_PAEBA|nr:hypothetical protein DFQ00_12661 [Paenibacillus barcinonensis]